MFQRLKIAMKQTHIMFYISLVFILFPIIESVNQSPINWGLLGLTFIFLVSYLSLLWSRDQRIITLSWVYAASFICYCALYLNPNFIWFLFYLGNVMAYCFPRSSLLSWRWLSIYGIALGIYLYHTWQGLGPIELFYLGLLISFIILFSIGQRFGRLRELMQEREEAKNKQINLLLAENERHRIRRDLHDNLGHLFATLAVKSELATSLMDRQKYEAAQEHIKDIHNLTQEAMHQVRAIINDLDHHDLANELIRLQEMLEISGIQVVIDNQLGNLSLTQDQSSTLALCLLEASNNIIKHAQAKHVLIRLWQNDNFLYAFVEDDGQGFGPVQEGELHTILDRLQIQGGQLNILSRRQPTQIQLKMPYEKG